MIYLILNLIKKSGFMGRYK